MIDRTRVARIAALMWSPQDGEAMNALRALRRVITRHQMVALIGGEPDRDTTIAMVREIDPTNLNQREREFLYQIVMQACDLDNDFGMTPRQASWFGFLYAEHAP